MNVSSWALSHSVWAHHSLRRKHTKKRRGKKLRRRTEQKTSANYNYFLKTCSHPLLLLYHCWFHVIDVSFNSQTIHSLMTSAVTLLVSQVPVTVGVARVTRTSSSTTYWIEVCDNVKFCCYKDMYVTVSNLVVKKDMYVTMSNFINTRHVSDNLIFHY